MPAKDERMLRDESGKKSFFRTWLQIWLVQVSALVWLDVLTTRVKLEAIHLELLFGTVIILGAGAGGPRMMQYLLPQLGKVTDALSRIKRDPREPNPLKDDETDE